MATRLEELQEQRNKHADGIQKFRDQFNEQGKKWKDDEQRAAWDKLNADYDAVVKEADEIRAADQVEARAAAIKEMQDGNDDERRSRQGGGDGRDGADAGNEQTRALALNAWFRAQLGHPISKDQESACRAVGLHPGARQLRLQFPGTNQYRDLQTAFRSVHPSRVNDHLHQSRALNSYTLGSGGMLVPNTLLQTFEVNMLAFGGIRQVAELMVTGSGGPLTWPTIDSTAMTGRRVGEAQSVGSSGEPTFGGVAWNDYKYTSGALLVNHEILEDSILNLPTLIGAALGESISRKTAVDFTTGNGAAGPRGIMTAATLGVTAAAGGAIKADELIDLEHSVDPAYRIGASWMFHDSVLAHLRKLKTGDGQYLWMPGMNTAPDSLLNRPYTISMEMDSSVASGKKTVLFGQLSKYKIRRVNEMRLYRLEERYRENDQEGFIAVIREDGNLLTAGTAPVKYLIQP